MRLAVVTLHNSFADDEILIVCGIVFEDNHETAARTTNNEAVEGLNESPSKLVSQCCFRTVLVRNKQEYWVCERKEWGTTEYACCSRTIRTRWFCKLMVSGLFTTTRQL